MKVYTIKITEVLLRLGKKLIKTNFNTIQAL